MSNMNWIKIEDYVPARKAQHKALFYTTGRIILQGMVDTFFSGTVEKPSYSLYNLETDKYEWVNPKLLSHVMIVVEPGQDLPRSEGYASPTKYAVIHPDRIENEE